MLFLQVSELADSYPFRYICNNFQNYWVLPIALFCQFLNSLCRDSRLFSLCLVPCLTRHSLYIWPLLPVHYLIDCGKDHQCRHSPGIVPCRASFIGIFNMSLQGPHTLGPFSFRHRQSSIILQVDVTLFLMLTNATVCPNAQLPTQ